MTQHHVVASPPQAGATDRQQRLGGRFQRLQALEDALKFRRARAAAPCEDCAAALVGRCDDYGRDLDLIGEYEQTARRICAELDAITGPHCRRVNPTP
jgi:hypothetical protein